MSLYPPRTSQASSRLYDVPKLDNEGSNFQTWKYRITTVLELRDLLGVVTGTEPDPGPSNSYMHEEWTRKDREARAQITLTLDDEPLSGVIHAATSNGVWEKLKKHWRGLG